MKAVYLYVIISLMISSLCAAQISKTNQNKTEKIIVYGSDTCHYCTDTKDYLKEYKIEFVYFDVDVNKEKEKEMVTKLQKAGIPLSSISLPVIDKSGIIFMNSDIQHFDAFLKKLN